MITSIPIEAFQRELLGKAKGYKLTDALAEGRRSEAILAGRQEIQKRTSTPLNNVDQVDRKKMFNNVVTPNRMANNIGKLAKAAVGETEDSTIWSQQPVTLQMKTPLSPMTAYAYPVYAANFHNTGCYLP